MIRIDIDAEQLDRHPAAVRIEADAGEALAALNEAISSAALATGTSQGAARAAAARQAARAEIGPAMEAQLRYVEAIRDAVPDALIVGDSTQPVYAGNLYFDHDRPGGWFNAATGYGALGYGPPAAIGAAIALPGTPVICLSGDGGFQFTLPELAAAVESEAAVAFVVWNNHGYREIETSMRDVGVEPVGVSPAPPDFAAIAAAYGLPFASVGDIAGLTAALRDPAPRGPRLIEIAVA
jgi:acetolactate synthase-1/2/3 large subunit